ncbi:SagB/ThcOx family dehydrogenase [Pseudomonas sp. ADAK2]|uniref:SagB/ThcOx family dehydrogenase n=1 Tax=Pseudomonas TaxID=286 RepID=UPI00146404AC|nr:MULTISPECIES: SagB/ThcOx family dehydrogenase [unclassified Pseudomonas]QJI40856.1 SagB/ThcOx family dehydrogenase [Pseudomonas sp. ADAK7]QJI47160.1 SagB/ThcOx family dehydrogenase [Pseudomonas sp. ADAK2]
MDASNATPLQHLLARRRSVRSYADEPVPLSALLNILSAGQGRTSTEGKRAAPSAHALYPLTLGVVVRRVDGLAPGFYRFEPESAQLKPGGHCVQTGALNAAALGDETWLEDAAVVVVIIGNRGLAIQHFAEQQADGLRGARYVDFEAGAVAQSMYLAVTAEGLGSVVVMGFDDAAMTSALGLDESGQPVALFCVGRPVV